MESAWEDDDALPGAAFEDHIELSTGLLHSVDSQQSAFETNPIYWVLHESIYCNGKGSSSDWSSQRVVESSGHFDAIKSISEGSLPINFTGEMVFDWFGEDFKDLKDLQVVADALAVKKWDKDLYNFEALKDVARKVDIAALVSYDDVFVERNFSEEVAELLGKEECKLWVTNEFQHSGLREDGERIFETLLKMCNGEVSLPS